MIAQTVKGVKDFYAQEAFLYQHIRERAYRLSNNFGFQIIELPIIEYSHLFQQAVGEHTDIVNKEMFTFQDQGGRSVCLRPEGTAQTVRFVMENGLLRDNLKRYIYVGAMFRAEKPQKGRQRQFHQIGLEIIGEEDTQADVDIIQYTIMFLEQFEIKDYHLKINSVGCNACRPIYNQELIYYLDKYSDKICSNCQIRRLSNPLRVLDCKNETCQQYYQKAPLIKDFLCQYCDDHFSSLKLSLKHLSISFIEDPFLVRGLDYYTQTAFEISLPNYLGAQNALCGGGRYNGLFEKIGSKNSVPAVGMAMGVERLLIALEAKGMTLWNKYADQKTYYIIVDSQFLVNEIYDIATFLRKNDCTVLIDKSSKHLTKKMKRAQKLDFHYSILFGEKEYQERIFQLKNMVTGEQSTLPLSNIERLIL